MQHQFFVAKPQQRNLETTVGKADNDLERGNDAKVEKKINKWEWNLTAV